MEEKLYEKHVKMFGHHVEVFPSKIVYLTGIAYMKKEKIIPVNQISSIEVNGFSSNVHIRTTNGKEIDIPSFSIKDRDTLKDTILSLL
ncbi:MAG: hypothetical protein WC472_01630 [Candidatus Paceibacterota bacterium]